MNKIAVLLCAAMLGMGVSQVSLAEGTAAQAAKPVSCTAEAKAKGLTDKKEIKAYIKDCKKARKAKKVKHEKKVHKKEQKKQDK